MSILVRLTNLFKQDKLSNDEESKLVKFIKEGNKESLAEIITTKKIDDSYLSRVTFI